ncbi:MAG: caspase family protein [Leptolyngbyaceae cyanobacterium RU_5_1]|nr:caspase family protein [Leptolyngbyaceae cyanobacterium RU_5_1]
MAKVALLVGISTCEVGLPLLNRARTNVEVLKRALQGTNSGFDVKTLHDPPLPELTEIVEQFFRHREHDDQILFLFSGYGIKDTDDQLYLAAPTTALDDRGNLIRARTLPASFLQNVMDSSPAWRQVVIFDCCFRLTPGIQPTEDSGSMEDVFDHLIGDRRVILSASTRTQQETEPENLDAWSYTRYHGRRGCNRCG